MSVLVVIHTLCCLSFLLGARYVHCQGTRITIHLPKSFQESYEKRLSSLQVAGGSCDDYEEVDRSSLDLPGKLDDLNERVKFYRSASAAANLRVFENFKVPGLGGDTVGEVFAALRANGCHPFVYGGAVRDQFLVRAPRDADVDVDCTLDQFMEICQERWGEGSCYHREGSSAAHIGSSMVDLVSTDITFYASLCDLDYTVNSLAYDMNGNDVIIDLTGTGVDNACKLQIAIPSDDNTKGSYKCWFKEGGDGMLFRAWKLRTKGLDFYDNFTGHFIMVRAYRSVKKHPEVFAEFYCKTIYRSKYDFDTGKCIVSSEQCTEGEEVDCKYKAAFLYDFGNELYNTRMLPVMEKAQEDCIAPTCPSVRF